MQYIHFLWAKCCVDNGLGEPAYGRGFDLRYNNQNHGDAVGAYLTKWGHELTYGHTKMTRGDRRHTPFSMLAHIEDVGYDPYFYKLFGDYAKAFKGRAQLYWSRGLKDHFSINDISDSELSERPEPIYHCDITKDQHTAISLLNMFQEVLTFAESHSPEETLVYLDLVVDFKNKPSVFWSAISNDKNFRNYRKHLGSLVETEFNRNHSRLAPRAIAKQ